jgi:hypothetical protein
LSSKRTGGKGGRRACFEYFSTCWRRSRAPAQSNGADAVDKKRAVWSVWSGWRSRHLLAAEVIETVCQSGRASTRDQQALLCRWGTTHVPAGGATTVNRAWRWPFRQAVALDAIRHEGTLPTGALRPRLFWSAFGEAGAISHQCSGVKTKF